MKIKIIKCHGSGNDFVLIDDFDNNYNLTNSNYSEVAKILCDRKYIGSDGMLVLRSSDVADCKMTMFNPDGSEAEMCGNGIRCIARCFNQCIDKNNKDNIKIETMKSILNVMKVADIADGVASYKTEIYPISLDIDSLPMSLNSNNLINSKIESLDNDLLFSAISVPNPHIISFVNDIDENLLNKVGKNANNSDLFPKGVNVSFCKILDKNKLYVITYERGVGITYSCGTAMSASVFISCYLNYFSYGETIMVLNKGGFVLCEALNNKDDKKVFLTGNATLVFKAVLDIDLTDFEMSNYYMGDFYMDEVVKYEAVENKSLSILKKFGISIE